MTILITNLCSITGQIYDHLHDHLYDCLVDHLCSISESISDPISGQLCDHLHNCPCDCLCDHLIDHLCLIAGKLHDQLCDYLHGQLHGPNSDITKAQDPGLGHWEVSGEPFGTIWIHPISVWSTPSRSIRIHSVLVLSSLLPFITQSGTVPCSAVCFLILLFDLLCHLAFG